MTSRARPGPPVRRRVLGGRNAILLKPVAIIIPDTAKEKLYARNQSWALLCGSYLCKPDSQFKQLRCMDPMVQLVSVKQRRRINIGLPAASSGPPTETSPVQTRGVQNVTRALPPAAVNGRRRLKRRPE